MSSTLKAVMPPAPLKAGRRFVPPLFFRLLACILLASLVASAQLPMLAVPLLPQDYPLWAGVEIGPYRTITMGDCGCAIAVTSMILEYLLDGSGSIPWFAVVVNGTTIPVSFSPVYVNQYLSDTAGPFLVGGWDFGWGYFPQDDHTVCGTAMRPYALASVAQGVYSYELQKNMTPTGVWRRYVEGQTVENYFLVTGELAAGRPVYVRIKNWDGSFHAELIVGEDARYGGVRLAILNPSWNIPAAAAVPGSGDYNAYQRWLSQIQGYYFYTVTYDPNDYWLELYSDPSQVDFFAISPTGLRTGRDPATGILYQEDSSASYEIDGGFQDPFGDIPPGVPTKSISVRNPMQGTYRFQVTATGAGPLKVALEAVAGRGTPTTLFKIDSNVTTSESLKYEVDYSPAGASVARQVSAWTAAINGFDTVRASAAGGTIAYDVSASVDPNGTALEYSWDFGDGTTAAGSNVGHVYAAPGLYTVTLTATNSQTVTTQRTGQVYVLGDGATAVTGITALASRNPGDNAPLDVGVPRTYETLLMQGGATRVLYAGASITPDGHYAVFSGGFSEGGVYVRDLQANVTERIDQGVPDGGTVSAAAISADGRYVVFTSNASTLVPQDTNDAYDILVRDRAKGTTERVSVASDGTQANGDSYDAVITPDGRYVVFNSFASNLVSRDTNGTADTFIHDRSTGVTERVSVTSAGEQVGGCHSVFGQTYCYGSSGANTVSPDGRFIAFNTSAFAGFMAVRDRQNGTTAEFQAYMPQNGGSMTADGRLIAVELNNHATILDTVAGTFEAVDKSSAGIPGDDASHAAFISADGRYVTFVSWATNLAPPNSPKVATDAYLRDRARGTTERINISSTGAQTEPDTSGAGPWRADVQVAPVTPDGRFVAFTNDGSGLAADSQSSNFITQLYVRTRLVGGVTADPSGPYVGWAAGATAAAISFDASKSFDPLHGALTASWDFGDGTPAVIASVADQVSHTYSAAGSYAVGLAVSNGAESNSATSTVQVLPGLAPLTTAAPISCAGPGDTFTISASHNPLVPTNTGWNYGAGPLPSVAQLAAASQASLSVSGPGSSIVSLPVSSLTTPNVLEFSQHVSWTVPADAAPGTYSLSLSGGAPTALTVPCAPSTLHQPQADIGGPYAGTVGRPITFDGTKSRDVDGKPLTYAWNFGDGTTGSGPAPEHTYQAMGRYLASLVVSNGEIASQPGPGTGGLVKVAVEASCDVNQDLTISMPDTQMVVNESLGLGSAAGDVSGDGVVNVVDVQVVMNAVMGLGCSTGTTSLPPVRQARRRR